MRYPHSQSPSRDQLTNSLLRLKGPKPCSSPGLQSRWTDPPVAACAARQTFMEPHVCKGRDTLKDHFACVPREVGRKRDKILPACFQCKRRPMKKKNYCSHSKLPLAAVKCAVGTGILRTTTVYVSKQAGLRYAVAARLIHTLMERTVHHLTVDSSSGVHHRDVWSPVRRVLHLMRL